MSEFSVLFPPDLQHWVETRLADGDYADLADYLGDLVRRDRAFAAERAALRVLIEEGIASGIDPREPAEIFAEILAEDPDLRV